MQSQFAELLYDCRHDLARAQHLDSHQIGELLAEYGPDPDSRFGALLQQTELTGRLVFALRHEGIEGVVSPIDPTTLKRIVADLEKKRRARDWLHEARRVMREAPLHASGLLSGAKTGHSGETATPHQPGAGTSLLAAARLEGEQWTLGVSFPDIKSLLEAAEITPAELSRTRFKLPGDIDTWRPGGALLNLSRKLQMLKALPSDGNLIAFDRSRPGIDDAFVDALSIRGKSPWILRIHADGIARQALGHHIKPGHAYVLVCTEPLPVDVVTGLNLPDTTDKPGHRLYYYQAPPVLSEEQITALAKAGFGYALGASIEPIGIVPRWDANSGASIWLPSDDVILRLSAIYPVVEFQVSVDSKSPTHIPVPKGSSDVLLSVGKLPIGRHSIEIAAIASQSIPLSKAQQSEVLGFEIRSPQPQRDSFSTIAGIKITLDPVDAKLDELLARKAAITIVGPIGRKIDVGTDFYDVNGHKTSSHKLAEKSLPIDPTWIHQKLERLKDDAFFDEMQSSSKISISFGAEELGSSSITFSTSVDPIRWRLSKSGKTYRARMIDEADSPEQLMIARYPVATPDKRMTLSAEECLTGFEISAPGALFEVTAGPRRYTTMVCPPPTSDKITLSDLFVEPVFTNFFAGPGAACNLADQYEIWGDAKTLGPFAPVYKWKMTQAIEARAIAAFCGPEWASTAAIAVQTQDFAPLQSKVGSPGFALQVRKIFQGDGTLHDFFEAFMIAAGRYQVCGDHKWSRLALDVAFEPPTRWSGDIPATADNLTALASRKVLIRAAFFAKAVAAARNNIAPDTESAA